VVSQVSRATPVQSQGKEGLVYHSQYFSKVAQQALLADLLGVIDRAALFQPVMPRTGKPFSVVMSNCGSLGWVSDRAGYRYQPHHPDSGAPWPAMPPVLLDLWRAVAGYEGEPEACLINIYGAAAKMGSHQDRDEKDFTAPVVSVSLGCSATFHVGGLQRTDPKVRMKLHSGDVVVIGGASRLAFHGIDRIAAGTSPIDLTAVAPDCARINLTLRRVHPT
jgi:DNA oxidative demethylase